MPSDKRNSIMAKATGLIFSLFNVASAREVPFGILQYVQCILHGLTTQYPYCAFLLWYLEHSRDITLLTVLLSWTTPTCFSTFYRCAMVPTLVENSKFFHVYNLLLCCSKCMDHAQLTLLVLYLEFVRP